MKILNKIIAIFKVKNESVEMNLKAAEIKEGKAFLHPVGEDNMTYIVPSDDVSIILKNSRNLDEQDIIVYQKPDKKSDKKKIEFDKNKKVVEKITPPKKVDFFPEGKRIKFDLSQFKRKSFTIQLYPEEYERITSVIKEYGYKREEFVLACVNKANKRTVTAECKRIKKDHVQKKEQVDSIIKEQEKDIKEAA